MSKRMGGKRVGKSQSRESNIIGIDGCYSVSTHLH